MMQRLQRQGERTKWRAVISGRLHRVAAGASRSVRRDVAIPVSPPHISSSSNVTAAAAGWPHDGASCVGQSL